MAESITHLELVSLIVSYIRNNYRALKYVSTLHDMPGVIGCDKPPKIGVYRPDVYAIDAPLTRTIIGEAKTQGDLESAHTRRQFKAFLRFLRLQDNSLLIVAVPWQAHFRARTLLHLIQKEVGASVVDILIIDNVQIK